MIFEATPTLSYASGDYNITAAVDFVSPEQEVKFDYAAGTLGLNFAKETQVEAARNAGIDVKANIHNYDDLLPSDLVGRFTTKKGIPQT